MAAAQKTRQARATAGDVGPFRFDRRATPRRAIDQQRLAVVFRPDGGRGLLPVRVRDASPGGVGLVASGPIAVHDRLTLYDEGRGAGFVRGRVVRVTPAEGGLFTVGVRLDGAGPAA